MGTLIFGANGYLGRHLVQRLSQNGRVTGFVRSAEGAATVTAAGGTPLIGTLEDEDSVRAAIAAHDRIVWAAQLMIAPEQEFVAWVLDRMKGTGKSFVFTSGTGVLSQRTDGDWSEASFAEDEPFEPRAGIAERLQTETIVRAASGDGLRAIVVRPPAIWGNGGSAIIAEIYRSVRQSGAACYMGRGLNCYSSVHVEDLAELYALALAKAPAGALYHAVSGELNFRVLAEAVARHLGVPSRSLDYGEARAVFGPSSTAIIFAASSRSRCPRARSELGWTPRPDRLDLLAECAHPAYAETAGKIGSWVSDNER